MIQSLVVTIIRCTSTVIFLYMFTYSPEVYGQSVTLDPSGVGSVTSCSKDLRVGDFYIVRGFVNSTNPTWSNFVDFQIRSTPNDAFQRLCPVSIGTCVFPNPQACYCAEKRGDIYEIVVNRSASLSNSNAEVRILWNYDTGLSVNSSTIMLPNIFDENAVTTRYTVDGDTISCPATIANGSVINYQCYNSPSPCDLTIGVNNTEVVKGEHNVTYLVSNLKLHTVFIFTFSYSVCGGGGSVQPAPCPVIIEDVITTSPTSSTAVTNGTTTLNTVTTVNVPTPNSTTAPLVSELPCSLSCEDWAIALSVIFFVAILVIISTGITILVEAIKRDKKAVAFYVCIGFLVFAEVLDIILIIVFAQADPCKCDPQPGIELALWEIMLIIFCIVNGLLIIATVGVVIWIFVFEENKPDTESNSPEVITTTAATTPNTRKPNIDKNKNGQKTTHVSNGKKDKEKTDEKHEMSQSKNELLKVPKLPNTPDETKRDEAETQASEQSNVKKLKKKKSSKRKKATKEQEGESSSQNRPLPDLKTTKNDLHPQPPTGTTMPNPYKTK